MGHEGGRRPKVEVEPRENRASGAEDDYSSFNATVGESIRRGRQAFGWTQVQLAAEAGLSSNYVARLERGELGPSLFVAHRICAALQIDLAMLLGDGSGTGSTGSKKPTPKKRAAG